MEAITAIKEMPLIGKIILAAVALICIAGLVYAKEFIKVV